MTPVRQWLWLWRAGRGLSSTQYSTGDGDLTYGDSVWSTLTGTVRFGIRVNVGEIVTLVTTLDPTSGWGGSPTTSASGWLADAL